MKSLLQSLIINSIAIAILGYFSPGISYGGHLATLIFAAIGVGFINAFIKPIISLILLPITVVTLGLIGWIINGAMLLLATLLISGFDVIPFAFVFGDSTIQVSLLFSYIIHAFLLNFLASLIRGIIK